MKPLKVTILDGRGDKGCEETCGGMDWLNPEERNLVRERLKERFGERVRVQFFDVAEAKAKAEFSPLLTKVEQEGITLPLLVIDGVIRISGQFDIRMLLDTVEAVAESSRG